MKKQKQKLYPMIYRPTKRPTVLDAASFRDRIIFYINPNTYLLAVQHTNGCILKVVVEKESFITGRIIMLTIGLVLAYTITQITNNIVFSTMFLILYYPIFTIIKLLYYHHYCGTKHTAEHMLCNFIKLHHRLPKNMKEIKQSSRISTDCGTCHFANLLIRYSISIFAAIVVGLFLVMLTNDKTLFIMVLPAAIFIFVACFFIRFKQIDKLSLKVSFFLQQHLTTKETKDSDILLAYTVANYWMRIVYPEYCNEEDFNNDLLKNYHVNIEEIEHLL